MKNKNHAAKAARVAIVSATAVLLAASSVSPALAASNGSTSSAASVSRAAVTKTPIQVKWESVMSNPDYLGKPLGAEVTGLKNGGTKRLFQNGAIYWSPSTGAHVMRGMMWGKWKILGAENSSLGYPKDDGIHDGLKNAGSMQTFQNGVIVWSATTGIYPVKGGIYNAWKAQGSQNGSLGYPLSAEVGGLKNGGATQKFKGGVIVWSPASGAHASSGAIHTKWTALGGQNGKLGYPTSDPIKTMGGTLVQKYQGGYITWTAKYGARYTTTPVFAGWARTGYESGLGLATADVVTGLKLGGSSQSFERGAIVSSSKGTYKSSGAIRALWLKNAAQNGRLGYPTSDEMPWKSLTRQNYTGGYITWSAKTGAKAYFIG